MLKWWNAVVIFQFHLYKKASLIANNQRGKWVYFRRARSSDIRSLACWSRIDASSSFAIFSLISLSSQNLSMTFLMFPISFFWALWILFSFSLSSKSFWNELVTILRSSFSVAFWFFFIRFLGLCFCEFICFFEKVKVKWKITFLIYWYPCKATFLKIYKNSELVFEIINHFYRSQ